MSAEEFMTSADYLLKTRSIRISTFSWADGVLDGQYLRVNMKPYRASKIEPCYFRGAQDELNRIDLNTERANAVIRGMK